MENINVTIANVIAWFEESEQCMLHNHAQKMIPTTKETEIQMTSEEKAQKIFDAFQRGFAKTNVTLTRVEFLDLIPDELKSRQAHPTHKQGEAK